MITKNGRLLSFTGAYVESFAAVGGKTEGEGPMKNCFDRLFPDTLLGQDSWEKAESALFRAAAERCMQKKNKTVADCDLLFGGDLLDQCMGSAMALRTSGVPFLGLYGACSTMAESLLMAGIAVSSGTSACCLAGASSHFCSAERQFRFPLGYGGQRTPTCQRTVTGAGAVCVSKTPAAVRLRAAVIGRMVDKGVTDANNMGAAMAPAACDTLTAFFRDGGKKPEEFDLIVTGDLGYVGAELLKELVKEEKWELPAAYTDCGLLIYDREKQDVHAGGSGCGCAASVLCGYILPRMIKGELHNVLLAATGAMLSPTSNQQGDSIPGICHAVWLSTE